MTELPLLTGLDQFRELFQRHAPAGLVVGWRRRRAAGYRGRRGHSVPPSASVSVKVTVISPRIESSAVSNSIDLDHLLIRRELDEVAMVGVGVRAGLAGPGRRVVGERDAERAALAAFELMYVAGHATRHHPCRDRLCVDQRAIDICAGRVNMLSEARVEEGAIGSSPKNETPSLFSLRLVKPAHKLPPMSVGPQICAIAELIDASQQRPSCDTLHYRGR